MDLNTVIGVVLGWLLILGAIIIGGAGLTPYLSPPSVLIVVGGAGCALLIAFPMNILKNVPVVGLKAVFSKPAAPRQLIEKMVGYAEIARRDGILSLESMTSEMDDEFIVRGIQMAVDGTDPELIEHIMEAELENQILRHQQGKSLFDTMGRYSPAFGMIGTLIGLVAMLANMDDPSKIGAGMAAALLTTLYGSLIANLFALPMADKLGLRAKEEILMKTIIIQGVMAIQSGDNPRIVEQKLLTYVPPSSRANEEEPEERMAA